MPQSHPPSLPTFSSRSISGFGNVRVRGVSVDYAAEGAPDYPLLSQTEFGLRSIWDPFRTSLGPRTPPPSPTKHFRHHEVVFPGDTCKPQPSSQTVTEVEYPSVGPRSFLRLWSLVTKVGLHGIARETRPP